MKPLLTTSGCFAQGWLLDLLLGRCYHLMFSVKKAACCLQACQPSLASQQLHLPLSPWLSAPCSDNILCRLGSSQGSPKPTRCPHAPKEVLPALLCFRSLLFWLKVILGPIALSHQLSEA